MAAQLPRDEALGQESHDQQREARIRRVVSECFRRWAAGEAVSQEQVIAEHEELMPELGARLRQAQFVQQAADIRPREDVSSLTEEFLRTHQYESFVSRGLHIRCPHCRQTIELTADIPFTDVTCTVCGSTFSLVSHPADTLAASSLKRVANFELVSRLGLGSFGTVWKARDTELDRTVAVKIPRRGQLDADEEEKFLREARAAAHLKHPNIVSVHEVGRDGETLYIVSDLVRGVTLADWLTAHRLSPVQIARLCTKLAGALHHAHERGVVHRDLKPSNIMLDDDGEPHIMDFGLAKRRAPGDRSSRVPGRGEITMTVEGQILGTPAYMSPEQARGEGSTADRRSDIYSVGVILFELLTGELPFRGNPRMLVFQVIHDEPPSPRKLNGHVPRDLETICLKCLEKDPGQRYQTAGALADEFQRFVEGRPIRARRISRASRAWRWCKRNRAAAALLGLVLLVAVVAPLVAINQWVLSNRAQREAERADSERDEVAVQRNRLSRLLYVAHVNMAQQALEAANVDRAVELLSSYLGSESRGFEWFYLWDQAHRHEKALVAHAQPIVAVALSPDGQTLASADAAGSIVLWDLGNGRPKGEFSISGRQFTSVALVQGGRTLIAGDVAGAVSLGDVQSGELTSTLGRHADRVNALAVNADASRVASASTDKTAAVWDVASGERLWELPHKNIVTSVAFLADGRLATGSRDSLVRIWDLETGKETTLLDHDAAVLSIAVGQDDSVLASGTDDGRVTLWDLATGEARNAWQRHAGPVSALAIADSGLLLSAGSDSSVKLWDPAEQGAQADLSTVKGHTGGVHAAVFLPDDRSFATAGQEGTVKIWSTGSLANPAIVRPHQQFLDELRIIPRVSTPVSIGHDSATLWEAKIWPLTSEQSAKTLVAGPIPLLAMAVSPNGTTVAVGRTLASSDVIVCDAATGITLRELKVQEAMVMGLAFVGNERLAAAAVDGTVLVWDLGESDPPEKFATDGSQSYWCLSASPDGRWLAAGSAAASIELWDMQTNERETLVVGNAGNVEGLAFSADSKLLAVAGPGSVVSVWPVWAREPAATLRGHGQTVAAIAFSSDGLTLASGSKDGAVILWDVATWEPKLFLSTGPAAVQSLAFTSDDKTLLAGDFDGRVHVWRGSSPEPTQSLAE